MKPSGKRKAKPTLSEIRRAVADYMQSEGCSCCRNVDDHDAHKATLGQMLRVSKYSDGSGYDFSLYRTGVLRGPRKAKERG